jgi:hypothetical protein
MKVTKGQKIVVAKGLPSDFFINGNKGCGLTPTGAFEVHSVNPNTGAVCLIPAGSSITDFGGAFYWVQKHNMPR